MFIFNLLAAIIWIICGGVIAVFIFERRKQNSKITRVGNLMINPEIDEGIYLSFEVSPDTLKDGQDVTMTVKYWYSHKKQRL